MLKKLLILTGMLCAVNIAYSQDTTRSQDRVDLECILYFQELAEFPGGSGALKEFIKNTMVYPKSVTEEKCEGKVMVYFEISEEGKVENVKLMKGFDQCCNDEAVRIIKLMPDWKPAQRNEKPARTRMVIPIIFKLLE